MNTERSGLIGTGTSSPQELTPLAINNVVFIRPTASLAFLDQPTQPTAKLIGGYVLNSCRFRLRRSGWFQTLFALSLSANALLGASHYVSLSGNNTSPFTNWTTAAVTLQAAIDASQDGDSVIINSGIYRGSGNRDLDLEGKAISLTSIAGPAGVILDVEGSVADPHRAFTFLSSETHSTVVQGLMMINGYGPTNSISDDGVGRWCVGGAIYCSNSSPRIVNCVFSNNYAQYGSAIQLWDHSNASIERCRAVSNAPSALSCIYIYKSCSVGLTNCLISGNGGKGVQVDYFSKVELANCLVSRNSSSGLYVGNSQSSLLNCTIADNAKTEGAGFYAYYPTTAPSIENSILWGNRAPFTQTPGTLPVTVRASCVQNGYAGLNVITNSPQFEAGGYHLSAGSPCIDFGHTDPQMNGEIDLDGNPRVVNHIVDLGAYEYRASSTITVQPNPSSGGSVAGTGTYLVGTNVQISASANPEWTFTGWSDGNTQTSRTITVPSGGATYTANFLAPPQPYTIATNGNGTVSPASLNGRVLQAGKTYTVTAKPATGYVFAGWTISIVSSTPTLKFTMQPGLALQANFIPNPFILVKGTYNGLFYDTNGVSQPGSGYFSATITDQGAYSGKVQLAGGSYSLSGQLTADGKATNMITRPGLTSLVMDLRLDLSGGNRISGGISDVGWKSELMAYRSLFSSRTNPAPQVGKYTMIIPGDYGSTTNPAGNGLGTVTVTASGSVQLSATLADGTKLTQTTTLSGAGEWPLYASPYVGQGLILSWITLGARPMNDLSGNLIWIKPPMPKTKYYPGGFTLETSATGSRYNQPPNGTPILSFSSGEIRLSGGGLRSEVVNYVTLGANNRVTSTNKASLTFTLTTGTFTGSVPSPTGAKGKTIRIGGVVLQDQKVGKGYFLGTSESGEVLFRSQ